MKASEFIRRFDSFRRKRGFGIKQAARAIGVSYSLIWLLRQERQPVSAEIEGKLRAMEKSDLPLASVQIPQRLCYKLQEARELLSVSAEVLRDLRRDGLLDAIDLRAPGAGSAVNRITHESLIRLIQKSRVSRSESGRVTATRGKENGTARSSHVAQSRAAG